MARMSREQEAGEDEDLERGAEVEAGCGADAGGDGSDDDEADGLDGQRPEPVVGRTRETGRRDVLLERPLPQDVEVSARRPR